MRSFPEQKNMLWDRPLFAPPYRPLTVPNIAIYPTPLVFPPVLKPCSRSTKTTATPPWFCSSTTRPRNSLVCIGSILSRLFRLQRNPTEPPLNARAHCSLSCSLHHLVAMPTAFATLLITKRKKPGTSPPPPSLIAR